MNHSKPPSASNSEFVYLFLWPTAFGSYQAQSTTTEQPKVQPGGRSGGRFPLVIEVPFEHAPFVFETLQSLVDSVYQISNTEELWRTVQCSTDFQNVCVLMDSLDTNFYAMLLARETGIFINHTRALHVWVQSSNRLRFPPQMNTFTTFNNAVYYMITRGNSCEGSIGQEPIRPSPSIPEASSPPTRPIFTLSQPSTPSRHDAESPKTPVSKGKGKFTPKWAPPTPERINLSVISPKKPMQERKLDPDVLGT
ncbi:hypothetical protein MPER_12944 [Moniliophthora perniciosa FA553]|nr:hypothetical protein MPER_12944 [Moniliophthora perniciosa FA553]